MPSHLPIYAGVYVDDFIYFSASKLVKSEFEQRIKDNQNIIADFEVELKNVLGMKWQQISDYKILTIHLLQEATISTLVEELGPEDVNSVHPPYISGYPVNKIVSVDHLPPYRLKAA